MWSIAFLEGFPLFLVLAEAGDEEALLDEREGVNGLVGCGHPAKVWSHMRALSRVSKANALPSGSTTLLPIRQAANLSSEIVLRPIIMG